MKAAKTQQSSSAYAPTPWETTHFSPRPFNALQDYDRDEKKENKTGLPDKLKAGIEGLSGLSLDDVRVHYNSPEPAQLNALAYAQGSDIHLGPGQEEYLPHETWHTVQQKQGRVKPKLQTMGVAINNELDLESEASVVGNRATSERIPGIRVPLTFHLDVNSSQAHSGTSHREIQVIQRQPKYGKLKEEESDELAEVEQLETITQNFKLVGRKAETVTKRLKNRRRDEAVEAVKSLGQTWLIAATSAGLDVAAPGLGTGISYAISIAKFTTDIYEESKTGGGTLEGAKQILETGVSLSAEYGAKAHWATATASGTMRDVAKLGKAVAQPKLARKQEKIQAFDKLVSMQIGEQDEFESKLIEVRKRVKDLRKIVPSGVKPKWPLSRKTPSQRLDDMERRLDKVRKRVNEMFEAMEKYEQKPRVPFRLGARSDEYEEKE